MKTQLMNALMVGALLTTPTSFATSYASNPHLLAKVYAADFKAR